jgi:hypothetical protein
MPKSCGLGNCLRQVTSIIVRLAVVLISLMPFPLLSTISLLLLLVHFLLLVMLFLLLSALLTVFIVRLGFRIMRFVVRPLLRFHITWWVGRRINVGLPCRPIGRVIARL